MTFSNFHFAQEGWLWGLALLPAVWLIYRFCPRISATVTERVKGFIDEHLRPHLLVGNKKSESSVWKTIALWSTIWSFLMLALAGPRWGDYTELDLHETYQSLVIVLDLSQSMTVQDVEPSRIGQAIQQIEAVLEEQKGVKIGLVVFASSAHVIVPLSVDGSIISHYLPSLTPDIVYTQGTNLAPALNLAAGLLDASADDTKSILVISDGGFTDDKAYEQAEKLAKKNIPIYTMGIGTTQGGPVLDIDGKAMVQGGNAIISFLEADKLQELSKLTGGTYLSDAKDIHYAIQGMFTKLSEEAAIKEAKKHPNRSWDERFFLFVFPMMFLLLFWFRRGFVFPIIILASLSATPSEAKVEDFFKNSGQRGQEALDEDDIIKAIETFTDPYQKGVAYYMAGLYEQAEIMFRKNQRAEVAIDALYNLGNALAMQGRLQEAVHAYESVLRKQPDHEEAKHNLKLVKKIIEEQQCSCCKNGQCKNKGKPGNGAKNSSSKGGGEGQIDPNKMFEQVTDNIKNFLIRKVGFEGYDQNGHPISNNDPW